MLQPNIFRPAAEWRRRTPQYPRTESSHSEGDDRDATLPRADYTSKDIPEERRGYHNALQNYLDKANFEFNMERLRPQIEAFNRMRLKKQIQIQQL